MTGPRTPKSLQKEEQLQKVQEEQWEAPGPAGQSPIFTRGAARNNSGRRTYIIRELYSLPVYNLRRALKSSCLPLRIPSTFEVQLAYAGLNAYDTPSHARTFRAGGACRACLVPTDTEYPITSFCTGLGHGSKRPRVEVRSKRREGKRTRPETVPFTRAGTKREVRWLVGYGDATGPEPGRAADVEERVGGRAATGGNDAG